MSLKDLLALQKQIRDLNINSDSIELVKVWKEIQPSSSLMELEKILNQNKSKLESHGLNYRDLFENNFIKPVLPEELQKIHKVFSPQRILMKPSTGMSLIGMDLQKLLDDINREEEFVKYDIDFTELENEETSKIQIKESKKVKKIITDIYNDPNTLYKIAPREFEEIVAEILHAQGFSIELTKQTRDNGYDIIAIKDIKSQLPIKFLVECKRFSNKKVGVEIIRSFKEVIQTEKANRGIIVTTSYFSSEAIKKQKETPYLLDLRDKDHITSWVKNYYSERICS